MAELLTDAQIFALNEDFNMGPAWNRAQPKAGADPAPSQVKAVNTAEALWRGLPWSISPFDDEHVAERLRYPLALHSRLMFETQGRSSDPFPERIKALINPYLVAAAALTSVRVGSAQSGGIGPSPQDPGVDQTARDAAARAQTTADNAQAAADAADAAAAAAQTTADRAEGDAEANAQDIETNRTAIAKKQNQLMPPTNSEADKATSTAARVWSSALIRRVVESIVPAWARALNPPAEASPLLLESDHQSGTVALARNTWTTVGTITIPKAKLSGKLAILFDATADRTRGQGTISVRVMRGAVNVRTATDEVEVSGDAEHEQIVVLATDTPPETEDAVYTIQVNHNSANLAGTVHAREIIVLGGGVTGAGGGGLTEAQVRTIATTIADTAANAAVENGVQIPARAAPGNEIAGVQQYFGADFYAPDATEDQALLAHKNGSTYWGDVATQDDVDAGDVWTAYPTSSAASLTTNLRNHADRSVSKAAGLMVITAAFTTATRKYEVDDRYYIAPHQGTEAFMVLVSKAGGGPGLTIAERAALLVLIPEPAIIAFTTTNELTAAVRDITLGIPNPELLTGDVWVQGEIQGQPALARQKWTTATASLRLRLNASVGGTVSQAIASNKQLEVRLRFYDAANGGNELERVGVNIPLVKLPAAGTSSGGGQTPSTGGAGAVRGALIATSSVLSTSANQWANNSNHNSHSWSIDSKIPADKKTTTDLDRTKIAVFSRYLLALPAKPFSDVEDSVNGIWIVSKVGGAEQSTVFVPWGHFSGASTNDYSLNVGGNSYIYVTMNDHGAGAWGPELRGAGDAPAPNTTLEVYYAQAGGGGGSSAGGGGGVTQPAVYEQLKEIFSGIINAGFWRPDDDTSSIAIFRTSFAEQVALMKIILEDPVVIFNKSGDFRRFEIRFEDVEFLTAPSRLSFTISIDGIPLGDVGEGAQPLAERTSDIFVAMGNLVNLGEASENLSPKFSIGVSTGAPVVQATQRYSDPKEEISKFLYQQARDNHHLEMVVTFYAHDAITGAIDRDNPFGEKHLIITTFEESDFQDVFNFKGQALSLAQFNALTSKDDETIYFITDG